jgi:hypothetical protein
MKVSLLHKLVLVLTIMGMLTGFGLGDLTKKLGGDVDCSKSENKKKCKDKQKIKAIGKIIEIGAAATAIREMIIHYRVQQTYTEDKVVKEYKLKHKQLPPEPQVLEYSSTIKPGEIVKAGKEVLVGSKLVVIAGQKSKTTDIKERITIYDNEKKDKELISLTKPVNEKAGKAGAFENEFKFTLPVGMPQGVYPIKTLVLLNGKVEKPTSHKMQLVLNVDEYQRYQIVALNP